MPSRPAPPATPRPYSPEFLLGQRRRLEAARRRLAVQLARAGGPTGRVAGGAAADGARDDAARAVAGRPLRLTESDLALGVGETAAAALADCEAALRRLDDGGYGWDARAGAWLRPERLLAVPTAVSEPADPPFEPAR